MPPPFSTSLWMQNNSSLCHWATQTTLPGLALGQGPSWPWWGPSVSTWCTSCTSSSPTLSSLSIKRWRSKYQTTPCWIIRHWREMQILVSTSPPPTLDKWLPGYLTQLIWGSYTVGKIFCFIFTPITHWNGSTAFLLQQTGLSHFLNYL